MAYGVIKATAEISWSPSGVVLVGYCFPPMFMRDLLLHGDSRFVLVVHTPDKLCTMPGREDSAWEVVRTRGINMQFMDLGSRQLDRLAYGGSFHSLIHRIHA